MYILEYPQVFAARYIRNTFGSHTKKKTRNMEGNEKRTERKWKHNKPRDEGVGVGGGGVDTDREQQDGDSLCFKVGFILRLCSQPDGLMDTLSPDSVCVCICLYCAWLHACLCAKVCVCVGIFLTYWRPFLADTPTLSGPMVLTGTKDWS